MVRAYSVGCLYHSCYKVFLRTSNGRVDIISATLLTFNPLVGAGGGKANIIMSKTAKILVTIGVVFLFFIIFGAIAGAMSDAGQTPGILGLIAFGALIGALRAIWKEPKNEEQNNNNSILQK